MRSGKRRIEDDPPDVQAPSEHEPVGGFEPEPEPATVVEGDAVELPSDHAPEIHETPVYSPPPYSPAATPAGHMAGSAPAHAPAGAAASAPGWPDAGIDLTEHPEILVGAAFGGGLLLALILRKLGR